MSDIEDDWRNWEEDGLAFEDALAEAIEAWDGKSKAAIVEVHNELSGADEDYLDILVDYIAEDDLSDGATWLLHRFNHYFTAF